MANIYTEGFNGTNGTALSSSNNIFSSTAWSGTASATFDTTVGSLGPKEGSASARFSASVAGQRSGTLTATNVTSRWWSFYISPDGTAISATAVILAIGADATSGNRTFQFALNSALAGANPTAKIQGGSTSTLIGSVTAGVPINEWSRIDLSCVSGFVTLNLYAGNAACDNAVGVGITSTASGTAVGGVTAITTRVFGWTTSATGGYVIDGFREDDAAFPGPLVAPPPPVVAGDLIIDRS